MVSLGRCVEPSVTGTHIQWIKTFVILLCHSYGIDQSGCSFCCQWESRAAFPASVGFVARADGSGRLFPFPSLALHPVTLPLFFCFSPRGRIPWFSFPFHQSLNIAVVVFLSCYICSYLWVLSQVCVRTMALKMVLMYSLIQQFSPLLAPLLFFSTESD